MYILKASNMVLADWVGLYGQNVILNATCSLFPEFKNIKCKILSVSRSKSNLNVLIIYIKVKKKNGSMKNMKVDSGMTGLTVTPI